MLATPKLENLPEWNLDDLYVGPDSAEFKADIATCVALAEKFSAQFKGKLAGLGGQVLALALQDYEKLSDLIGRIGSYAQLYYVGDTTDSARSKF